MSNTLDVIIPCFGNSTLIEETLESLAEQTNKDFKVILVIDQLDDQYYKKVAKQFQTKLNLELLSLGGNFGITHATVKGVEHSSSQWVALVDHDDWLVPDAIDLVLKHLLRVNISVIAVFTRRVDSSTNSIHHLRNKNLYQGNMLGNFYGSTTQASIVHNFLSHLKVYRKSKFELLNDPRIDGIQDWYWLLLNSNKGEYSFIDQPLYIHRVHALQNTKTEVSLKSINKMQLQKQFISETLSPLHTESDYLEEQFSIFIRENISRISVSSILVARNRNFEIFAFNPILLLSLLSTYDSTEGVIVLVPRSQLDVTSLLTILGARSVRSSIGIAVSRELNGSTLVLKSQGGLFDFAVPLDPESELICSFAGLSLKHLGGDGSRYLSIGVSTYLQDMKKGVNSKFTAWYLKNDSILIRVIPIGSKRRAYIKKFYRLILR